jgi:hypothetical protein
MRLYNTPFPKFVCRDLTVRFIEQPQLKLYQRACNADLVKLGLRLFYEANFQITTDDLSTASR